MPRETLNEKCFLVNAECKKTFTVEDMLNAKLQGRIEGRAEAEQYLQKRVTQICITNRQLLKEIMRLDMSEPVSGVLVPYKLCLEIAVKLQESNNYDWHARKIKSLMNKSDRATLRSWKGVLVEIENG